MHDHLTCLTELLKMPRVLSRLGFWIWHGCIYKGYTVRSLSDYDSIRFNNAWICLNITQYPWIYLNMTEYCWMSLNMPQKSLNKLFWYVRVLNIWQYSYNNIIIVTMVVALEFLSARFVHLGGALLGS